VFFAAIFFGVLPAEKMQIIVTRRNETVIIDKPCFAFIILFSEPYIRIDKFHLGITDENGLFDARGQEVLAFGDGVDGADQFVGGAVFQDVPAT